MIWEFSFFLLTSKTEWALVYCPEALCLHSAASCTDCTIELDMKTLCPEPVAKPRLDKEIPMHALTALPDIESEEVDTKITKSKFDIMLDQLVSLKNMELVSDLRTTLIATALITADTQGAEVGEATVHTMQHSPEDLKTVAKTYGKDTANNEQ